ncbi:MAG: RagB/SusD family nutrient uptake outer membrane protein [Bacteroidales bacterium]
MIKKIKLYGVLTALAFSATSCLDKFPEDAIVAGEAISSVSEANQAIVGIYAQFKSNALYSGYLTLLPDIQTDLVYAVEGYSNTYGDIWRWNDIKGSNANIEAVYGQLYTVIGSCNFFFQEIEKLEPKIMNDDDLDKLQMYKGEAHFARALAYSELIKLFCKPYESAAEAEDELGVVLVSKYKGNGRLKRASLQASYDFVLADLAKAEKYLALEEGYTDVLYNAGYFTIGVVNSLYARMYLYMKNWEKAVEYSSKVIDSGDYLLSSASTIYTGKDSYYSYMWNYDSSTENIWRINFETTSYGGALGRVFLNYDYTSYRPDYVPAKWVLDSYDASDLRYESIFGTATTGYAHKLTWPLLIKYYGNKNFITQNILHVNMPKVFRLSEQYLIRAEAYCELEDYNNASKDITTLRKARYSSYGTSTSIGASTWKNLISEERVKELYMEGFRLNDLKRWHMGFSRTSQQSTVSPGNKINVKADDVRFVWPIPQHELESPDADIEPNESNK